MKQPKLLKLRKLNTSGFEHVFAMMFVMLAVGVVGTYLLVSANAATRSAGVDLSDPQCSIIHSLPRYKWGIVGLNGTYAAFGTNKCAQTEVRHFRSYALYVGTNYPSHHCSSAMTAYNCGIKAGKFDLALAKHLRLNPTKWWIDVEINNGIAWSTPDLNAHFVKGMFDVLHSTGKPVGIYSNRTQWQQITGGLKIGHIDSNWVATGLKSKPSASTLRNYCSQGFAGHGNSLVQYTNEKHIDVDVVC